MKSTIAFALATTLGLFVACSGNDKQKSDSSHIKSLEGVLVKNSQGQFQIGDIPVDVTGSQVTMDGKSGSINDVQHGMTVHAVGNMAKNGHSGSGGNEHHGSGHNSGHGSGNGHHGNMGSTGEHFDCTHITINPVLTGNIESIDYATRRMMVAGVTAVADASTYIVRSHSGTHTSIAFSVLQTGDPVHIFGVLQEDKTVLATRICLLPTGTVLTPSFTIQGVVSELNTADKLFQCGNFAVNYYNAAVSGNLANGTSVVVSGPVTDNTINAIRVSVVTSNSGGTTIVSGHMSGLNQGGHYFTLNGGGHCGSKSYHVDYSGASVDVNLATHKGNLCVEGTVSQQGHTHRLKATKVTK